MLWRVLHISVLIAINISVIRLNVTNLVVLKYLQAALHLGDAPLKGTCCLPWLSNNWYIQVRKAGVTRKLNAFWVNHNKANLLWSCAHEHRHDNSVEQDRLTRTGSTRYQQVRKAGKVNNNWLALRIATKGTLKRTALCKGQNVSQIDCLGFLVRNLNTNQRSTRNWRKNTNRLCSKRKRNIVLKIGDLVDALALAHRNLKRSNRRTCGPANHLAREAKLLKRGLKPLCSSFKLIITDGRSGRVLV